MSLPPGASSRDRWLDLADEARDKTREALANGDRRMAELWDEHERTLLRNAYEDVPHPDAGTPETSITPTGTVGDLTGPLANDPDLASPRSVADGEGVQVAAGDESAAMAAIRDRFLPIIIGAAGAQQWAQGINDWGNRLRNPQPESRPEGSLSSTTDPLPPIQAPGSPSEPPFDPEEWHMEQVLPANPIVVRGTTIPPLEPAKPHILIFPDLSKEFEQIFILQDRTERPETKDLNDLALDFLVKHNPGAEKIGGGRFDDGTERPEHRTGGSGIAWGLDSRPGSIYSDGTVKLPNGQIIHVQTVDVDKNGYPTQREWDTAMRLFKATGETVLLIGKPWQMGDEGPPDNKNEEP